MADLDDTNQALQRFWDERAASSATDAERVDSNRRSQRMRFESFVLTHDLVGRSILDVGCGVGDLYGHLRDREIACDYLGVDLSSQMIARCREKYPDGKFEQANILEWADEPRFDYTIAVAIHNVRVDGGRELLERLTRKQFALCRVATHLSLLTDRYAGFAPHIQPWRAEEVLTMALAITPWVTLRHDYLPHDFGITLYRKPYIETQPGLLLD
jgi:SAM-dependent methyltransferase